METPKKRKRKRGSGWSKNKKLKVVQPVAKRGTKKERKQKRQPAHYLKKKKQKTKVIFFLEVFGSVTHHMRRFCGI